jgi:hypothetical protein
MVFTRQGAPGGELLGVADPVPGLTGTQVQHRRKQPPGGAESLFRSDLRRIEAGDEFQHDSMGLAGQHLDTAHCVEQFLRTQRRNRLAQCVDAAQCHLQIVTTGRSHTPILSGNPDKNAACENREEERRDERSKYSDQRHRHGILPLSAVSGPANSASSTANR